VFTATPLAGNGLAVVHDADGVDDATMLTFARETRLSETTFVQSPGAEGADYTNRIWMTTRELPFAGHPSLGTAVAVARARGESQVRYVQRTGAGLQSVEVELDGRAARASMLQEPPVQGAEVGVVDALAPAGLGAPDAMPGLPPQVISTGLPHLIAPVRDVEVLARVRPKPEAMAGLLASTGGTALYLVAVDPVAGTARARGFFIDDTGSVGEDPATGSAAGPLAAYLHARLGLEGVAIDQGVEMGRPSRLDASIDGDRVRVGGDVVIVAEGVVAL
jgi:trans-2,3-dihydro-3-hydroxyanthranilate isomerase